MLTGLYTGMREGWTKEDPLLTHAREMLGTHPGSVALMGAAAPVECMESCFDCAQSCSARADACRPTRQNR
jgi:hypothetical protein